ncbi:MAG: hypothetical protein UT63_C0109G0007 [Candidatus Gottesmanbacteria bacterium GW2011_GWC2_39_8]|uniref:Uncharacterized protein n=1 Tax=Candidatus Gottesmanbacteria bacterium GW2011_GWC2_39_8 TaxID=1618450 RepID=A0A0G0PPA9_9BACT|nr:MAG: hypothetical protein UT63_C0109G0007 [Candidatus Gottesmanbacteria bacterium GW2011_GWC2_39_8]
MTAILINSPGLKEENHNAFQEGIFGGITEKSWNVIPVIFTEQRSLDFARDDKERWRSLRMT